MSGVKGFVVSLDKEVSDEYAEKMCNAIRMMSHVVSVDPVPSDFNDHIVEMRVRNDLRDRFIEFVREDLKIM